MIGPTRRVGLEVCVDSAAGLIAAVEGGADRIELCAALAVAGLTPSVGLMGLARDLSVPVYAMIRPRAGDFTYAPAEFDVMRRDIDAVRAHGLAGVVLGAARPDGELDAEGLSGLIRHAHGLGATLHRVFDTTPNLSAALETAIDLGFERVLTSGGAPTAPQGADVLGALVRQAQGRIKVMAGSGITSGNAAALVAQTGARELHASCSAAPQALNSRHPTSADGITRLQRVLGPQVGGGRVTQAHLVAELLAAISLPPSP